MKTRLLKKLRKQARNRITLEPLYGGSRIGIFNWDDGEWYRRSVLDTFPTDFKSPEDALPTLQWLREEYVRDAVDRLRLRSELEKY